VRDSARGARLVAGVIAARVLQNVAQKMLTEEVSSSSHKLIQHYRRTAAHSIVLRADQLFFSLRVRERKSRSEA
jgi:hypothetical protein